MSASPSSAWSSSDAPVTRQRAGRHRPCPRPRREPTGRDRAGVTAGGVTWSGSTSTGGVDGRLLGRAPGTLPAKSAASPMICVTHTVLRRPMHVDRAGEDRGLTEHLAGVRLVS